MASASETVLLQGDWVFQRLNFQFPDPRHFTILHESDFANGQISKFFQISVFLIKKKPFRRRQKS